MERAMHKHTTNKIVKKVLRIIAKQEKNLFSEIKWHFINGEIHVTHRFWEILAEEMPNHSFVDVYHCPGCGKFSLE